jgi:hypothetical protein
MPRSNFVQPFTVLQNHTRILNIILDIDICLVRPLPYNRVAVMHWKAKHRKDNEALRRLAVVLLKLASIAESIALRSRPFCAIVLWLLCRAEARTRDLAFRIGGGAAFTLPSAASPVSWLGGAGEAARLAERFRALAVGFFALSRQTARGVWAARLYGSLSQLADQRAVIGPSPCSGPLHRSLIDTS